MDHLFSVSGYITTLQRGKKFLAVFERRNYQPVRTDDPEMADLLSNDYERFSDLLKLGIIIEEADLYFLDPGLAGRFKGVERSSFYHLHASITDLQNAIIQYEDDREASNLFIFNEICYLLSLITSGLVFTLEHFLQTSTRLAPSDREYEVFSLQLHNFLQLLSSLREFIYQTPLFKSVEDEQLEENILRLSQILGHSQYQTMELAELFKPQSHKQSSNPQARIISITHLKNQPSSKENTNSGDSPDENEPELPDTRSSSDNLHISPDDL